MNIRHGGDNDDDDDDDEEEEDEDEDEGRGTRDEGRGTRARTRARTSGGDDNDDGEDLHSLATRSAGHSVTRCPLTPLHSLVNVLAQLGKQVRRRRAVPRVGEETGHAQLHPKRHRPV
jgi:hypothetical protein